MAAGEWPPGEDEPTKYWLSTLPADTERAALVGMAKMRWRVERDDQDLKQEVGLGHDEGRGWRGFHHHATLCIAAYGFLISQRETIPPLDPDRPQDAKPLAFPKVTERAALPIRPARHVTNSIATVRRAIAVQLARTRPRCPCCARGWKRPSRL